MAPSADKGVKTAAFPRQDRVEEIAVAFLLSEGAGPIAAQVLRVDGGIGRGL